MPSNSIYIDVCGYISLSIWSVLAFIFTLIAMISFGIQGWVSFLPPWPTWFTVIDMSMIVVHWVISTIIVAIATGYTYSKHEIVKNAIESGDQKKETQVPWEDYFTMKARIGNAGMQIAVCIMAFIYHLITMIYWIKTGILPFVPAAPSFISSPVYIYSIWAVVVKSIYLGYVGVGLVLFVVFYAIGVFVWPREPKYMKIPDDSKGDMMVPADLMM